MSWKMRLYLYFCIYLLWTNITILYWLWSLLRLCQYLCITMTDCLMIPSQASTDRKQAWVLASLWYLMTFSFLEFWAFPLTWGSQTYRITTMTLNLKSQLCKLLSIQLFWALSLIRANVKRERLLLNLIFPNWSWYWQKIKLMFIAQFSTKLIFLFIVSESSKMSRIKK